MAQDMYADQVANIREKLARVNDSSIESYADMAENITEQYTEKMKEYADKWKAVQDAGSEELSGVLGVKGIYAGGKKIRDLYRGRQERKTAQKEKAQKEEVGEDDDFDADPSEIDVGDRADELTDFQKPSGETFFKGTDSDRQEFYDDDGDLKSDARIPEGHQETGGEEPPQEGEQNAEDEEEDNPFTMPDDVRDSLQKVPPDPLDVDQPSFVDVVAQGQKDRTARRQRYQDDPADESSGSTPADSFDTSATRAQPALPDRSEDPFQPSPSEAPNLRNQYVRDDPVDQPSVIGGDQPLVSGALKEGEQGGESFLSRVGSKTFQSLAERGRGIQDTFKGVKDFFSPSQGLGSAGAEGAEAGAEAGGEALAGLGTADAVLGSIPVIGEVALAISGLVGIGEGIYHLFHPQDKPPPPKPNAPIQAPHNLTQKYAMALPSVDNAVDRSGAITSF